jgi:hypothetical protein
MLPALTGWLRTIESFLGKVEELVEQSKASSR